MCSIVLTSTVGTVSVACIDEQGSTIGRLDAAPAIGLVSIEVKPAHRRKGIAVSILSRYVQFLKDKTNLKTAVLTCCSSNTAVISLCQRVGFKLAADRDTDSAVGDAVFSLELGR